MIQKTFLIPVFTLKMQVCAANLVSINSYMTADHNYVCGHFAAPPAPQGVTTVSTDTSVLVSWQALGPPPDSYRITITYTSTSNQTYTLSTQELGTATEVEYSQLIPQQQYTCCVIAIYGTQTFDSCESFQTSPSPSPSPTPSPTPSPSPSPSPITSPSSSTLIVGGVLGFVIAVLVLLLVVAGVGLAYPRCIRSRGKGNSR